MLLTVFAKANRITKQITSNFILTSRGKFAQQLFFGKWLLTPDAARQGWMARLLAMRAPVAHFIWRNSQMEARKATKVTAIIPHKLGLIEPHSECEQVEIILFSKGRLSWKMVVYPTFSELADNLFFTSKAPSPKQQGPVRS